MPTVPIDDIYPARKLKELLELTGAFRLDLDTTVSPVVVLETFQASDEQRGPVEAFVSGQRTGTGLVGAYFYAFARAGQTSVDGVPRIFRIRKVTVAAEANATLKMKVVPGTPTFGDLLITIFQDRRFQAFPPQLEIRQQNDVVSTLPAGGVNVMESRLLANRAITWEPERLILVPGLLFVVFLTTTSVVMHWALEWDELDARETSLSYR